MRILISGFEPFGGLTTNPTMELLQRAKTYNLEGIDIQTITLPVVYQECMPPLLKQMEEFNPDVVLCLGVAVGRSSIDLERTGINIQDSAGEGDRGDNSGDKPVDRPVIPEGPDGLFATLPIRDLLSALREKGIPAKISNSAGTYICNTTLYSLMYEIHKTGSLAKGGFIHVPATPDMAASQPHLPSMDIVTQEKALKIVISKLKEIN
ncbi:pyroglutamyl-peptidase I [Salipaludibacillus aurantiacus]|uniref:Pyroglutamyl-peptidase I n=1 Tax=Salipaludibacillus aurantiacus TaxID=1601833 RepID=A0A1H9T8D8_9BACI|nr:pyroglutamyl-peptidase I [Salipaludibacillus aurantiacus]SER93482.1 pyroglutamyl-peptidase [Salipaludibacillus aurantiacus]